MRLLIVPDEGLSGLKTPLITSKRSILPFGGSGAYPRKEISRAKKKTG